MSEKDFKYIYSELIALLAIQEAQFMANPKPYYKRMNDLLFECQKTFNDLEYALSPDIVFDTASEMDIEPIDFQGEALVRCNKALDILQSRCRTGSGV